jgi:GNAT superfamily N-acetyltransferase
MTGPSDTIQEYRSGQFLISTDPDRLDINAIHAFLTRSWWAEGIPREAVARAVPNSLCFGVFDGEKQIGFARVISDFATYAYLCDDYVVEEYRGRGLGSWLMECIFRHPDLQGLRRWMVIAQEPRLYAKFGFKPLAEPQIHMEILNPDIYEETAPHVA